MSTLLADDRLQLAGLRTNLVARLTGLSEERLKYWHRSVLQEATLRPGSRGIPRLYNWVDYMRLRVIAVLVGDQVPTVAIRRSVTLLDEVLPDWYLLPERTAGDQRHVFVAAAGAAGPLIADRNGQMTFGWPEALAKFATAAANAMGDLTGEGSDLGVLRAFTDAVVMDPGLNLAKPTLRGTSLETRFVKEMATDVGGAKAFADLYHLDANRVRRAIAFEEAVA